MHDTPRVVFFLLYRKVNEPCWLNKQLRPFVLVIALKKCAMHKWIRDSQTSTNVRSQLNRSLVPIMNYKYCKCDELVLLEIFFFDHKWNVLIESFQSNIKYQNRCKRCCSNSALDTMRHYQFTKFNLLSIGPFPNLI